MNVHRIGADMVSVEMSRGDANRLLAQIRQHAATLRHSIAEDTYGTRTTGLSDDLQFCQKVVAALTPTEPHT